MRKKEKETEAKSEKINMNVEETMKLDNLGIVTWWFQKSPEKQNEKKLRVDALCIVDGEFEFGFLRNMKNQ